MKKSLSLISFMLLASNLVMADGDVPAPQAPMGRGPMGLDMPMPDLLPMPMMPNMTMHHMPMGKSGIVLMNLGCTDITEHPTKYVLKIDTPGIQKGNVKVSVQDGMLVVEAKRNDEKKVKEEKEGKVVIIAQERQMESFVRTFDLPQDVDPNYKKIHAKLDDGVLMITLNRVPKKVDEVKVS